MPSVMEKLKSASSTSTAKHAIAKVEDSTGSVSTALSAAGIPCTMTKTLTFTIKITFSQYFNTDSDMDPDTNIEVRNEHFATANDQRGNATTLISTCPQPPTVLYAAILVPTAINTFQIFLAVIIFS